uniref:Apple domain-containing protein n=2 Tax=Panagrellus redivivus TaxID=6233 RepID=A0A7E4WBU2_PANRE
MLVLNTFILLCNTVSFCYGSTGFIHLLGYGLVADTLTTYVTSDYMDCIDECLTYENCLAIEMMISFGICNLLTMVRSYTLIKSECSFLIKNVSTMTITGRSLDPMDQVIQNVVYASKNVCPDGWSADSTTCTLSTSESVCNEYDTSLEASWNGTDCIIPLLTAKYSCPSKLTLKQFSNGYFCYALVLRNKNTAPDDTTYQKVNADCYRQTGAYLASVHSMAENDYISGLRDTSLSSNAVGIGLIPTSENPVNASYYAWIDGTPLDYELFASFKQPYIPPMAQLAKSGGWVVRTATKSAYWTSLKSLACKANANVVFTKVN